MDKIEFILFDCLSLLAAVERTNGLKAIVSLQADGTTKKGTDLFFLHFIYSSDEIYRYSTLKTLFEMGALDVMGDPGVIVKPKPAGFDMKLTILNREASNG